jgi:hypothetical protein
MEASKARAKAQRKPFEILLINISAFDDMF